LYSNDLRSGQRDLFLSLRDLLQIAPEGVEVYTTATASMRGGNNGFSTTDERPPFLHAKYVVIDQEWTAVGSWNLWTRGSFYEIEHEALVQSATIAQELERKFEEECEATAIRLWTAQDCERSEFCPSGCLICRGFGPFFK
jgi:phosphatidylserine/phosphatidylglycerophosphate/cardiolipin synthase-like enzyme